MTTEEREGKQRIEGDVESDGKEVVYFAPLADWPVAIVLSIDRNNHDLYLLYRCDMPAYHSSIASHKN